MTRETLGRVRMIVPGLLLLVLLTSVLTPTLTVRDAFGTLEKGLKSGTALAIAVVLVGCVYRILRLNKRLLRPSLVMVDNNIKNRLLAMSLPGSITEHDASRLRASKALLDIFYKIVDSDPSLKVRVGLVYENGAKLTSVIDGALIGMIGATAHLLAMLVTNDVVYFRWFVWWSLVFLVCWLILLPLVEGTHLKLSNDQLRPIAANYEKEVREGIQKHLAVLSS